MDINYSNIDGEFVLMTCTISFILGLETLILTLNSQPNNGDFTLQPSSPCIDAGDPESDLDPDGQSLIWELIHMTR